jgi:phosphopantothenoylcysteine decarboxylase/phosphopantothenate--cysteine ligase
VGFAAETHDVEAYARAKLAAKKLDLIAANRVGVEGSGFESDENTLVVYGADASTTLGPGAKADIAHGLLDLIEARLA